MPTAVLRSAQAGAILTSALSRLTRILLLVAVALCLGAPTAGAAPAPPLDNNLAKLWTTILQTPSAENPFFGGGCFDLGGTVAPFGAEGFNGTCTVESGTKIFVAASSVECSTFPDDGPGPDATEAELLECAVEGDQVMPSVTVDGKPVPVTEVETRLLHITLPEGNLFGLDAGTKGQSVGHGWVTLLDRLTPGTHTIVIDTDRDKNPRNDITTTIVVV